MHSCSKPVCFGSPLASPEAAALRDDAARQQRRDTGGPARQVLRGLGLPSTPVRGVVQLVMGSISSAAKRLVTSGSGSRRNHWTLDSHAATDAVACVCAGAGRHEGIRLLPALRTRAFSSSAPRVQLCAHPAVRCAPGRDAPHRRPAAATQRRRASAPLRPCPAARAPCPTFADERAAFLQSSVQQAFTRLPEAQGLYNPNLEKDNCGVGMIANLKKEKSHRVVRNALQASQSMRRWWHLRVWLRAHAATPAHRD